MEMTNGMALDIIRYLFLAIVSLLLYIYRGLLSRIRDLEKAVFPERYAEPRTSHRRYPRNH